MSYFTCVALLLYALAFVYRQSSSKVGKCLFIRYYFLVGVNLAKQYSRVVGMSVVCTETVFHGIIDKAFLNKVVIVH